MPNLAVAARIAIRCVIKAAKVQVKYTRTNGEVSNFAAGLGPMSLSQDGMDGQLVDIHNSDRRDLIAWRSDIVFEPKRGDSVQITLSNGDVAKFEVSSKHNLPHWKYTDEFQTAVRIHLKEVS